MRQPQAGDGFRTISGHVKCAACHENKAQGKFIHSAIPLGCNVCHEVRVNKDVTRVKLVATSPASLCLTCHADKNANVIPQFAFTSTSSHPVTHVRSSALPQPSLLANMLNLDGVTQGRSMGTQILCTDCHNSDDDREFGGLGPNGPHGSKWTHILERRYEFSQAPAPGQLITNLFPSPDLSVNGPYALCAKCHNPSQIMANTSFSEHARHINDGFSCSACHTAHGMGSTSGTISGERLVNFDVNVIAPNGAAPISYSRATNACSLTCHNHPHSLLGGAANRAVRR